MIEQEQRIGFNSPDKRAVLPPSFGSCSAHIPLVAINRYLDGIFKATTLSTCPPQPPRPKEMTGKPKQPNHEKDNGSVHSFPIRICTTVMTAAIKIEAHPDRK